MSEARIGWLFAYTFHFFVAGAGPMLCLLVLSLFVPHALKLYSARGPYFWGAAVFGTLLGILVGRKAKPSILAFLWLIPCALFLWELHTWIKYQYPGEDLKQKSFLTPSSVPTAARPNASAKH